MRSVAVVLPLLLLSPCTAVAQISQQAYDVKVPVVLGVMSACPDAIFCETVFDKVLEEVSDRVDLTLSYIGRINNSQPVWGVTCMHGPNECAGNVQQLCAAKYAPSNWWNFVQCMNHEGRFRVGLPEVAFKCASVAGIDWKKSGVGVCSGLDEGGGEEGVTLLKNSVRRSRDLGITKSCTIMINGKKVCVHDQTWKECEGGHRIQDFVKQINDEFKRLNGRVDVQVPLAISFNRLD